MTLEKIIIVIEAIRTLHDYTEVTIDEIIDALIGTCFDEEDAGRLKRFHQPD